METCQQESLQEAGKIMRPAETPTAGTFHLGSTELGQETAGGDGGIERGKNSERGYPLPRKAWRRVRGWYRVAVDHALSPA